MEITEPTTMLTDYALGGYSLFLSYLVIRQGLREKQKAKIFWGISFFFIGFGAFLGGTSHGFSLVLSEKALNIIWLFTLYSIGSGSFSVLCSVKFSHLKGQFGKILLTLAIVKFSIFIVMISKSPKFIFAILDYVPSILVVLTIFIWAHFKLKDEASKWMISAILITFIAAGLQVSGWDIHKHFSHNDLYHVIQIGGMYLFYRGASLLKNGI